MSYPTSAADAYATPQQHSDGYDARPTNSQGYAVAANHEEDDDDDDEEWNVYDDFNMTRPIAHRTSTTASNWDASKPSLVETPYTDDKRQSLLHSESFGFDVRNADPRRSMLSQQRKSGTDQYRSSTNGISGLGAAHADGASGFELITVPALGTEYTKEELKAMSAPSRRRRKRSNRRKTCQLWVSGQDHICGWLSPRVAVFIAFFFLAALGVMLYFVIPRVPTFAILSSTPVTAVPNGASMEIHRSPTNFSMDMDFNLRANNKASWIPVKLESMTMEVTDLVSSKLVGKGKLPSLQLPGRDQKTFQFPVHYSYASLNVSGDQTWQDFYTACGPNIQGTTRPTLNLGLKISMKVAGLIGTKLTYTQINNVVCPFTLQNDQ